MQQTIYQRITQYSEPESLPPMWQQVGLHVEAYRCPPQSAMVLFELTWEFSIDDLVDSGIVHRGPNELSISAALSDPSGVFLVRRQSPGELPDMLLTAAGVINGGPPTTMNSLRAATSHEVQSQTARRVFIVFCMADNLALRSIGLCALMAPDLANFNRDTFQVFCRECGWYSPENTDFLPPNPDEPHALSQVNTADSSTSDPGEIPRDHQSAQAEDEPFPALADLEIVFVNWSPAALTCITSAGLSPAIEFLSQAERHLGLDLSRVGIWRPDELLLESLRFRLRYGDRESVRGLIEDSIADSMQSVDGYVRQATVGETPRDYVAAAAAVERLVREWPTGNDHHTRLHDALCLLDERIQQELVAPLIAEAQATDNMRRRRSLYLQASLTSMLHRRAPLVQIDLVRAIREGKTAPNSTALRDFLAIVKELCVLQKDIY